MSNDKVALGVLLSEAGLIRLQVLQQRLALRRSGILLTAVRVCGMAHGCGNSKRIYYQHDDGEYLPLLLKRCRPFQIDRSVLRRVSLFLPVREIAAIKRCGKMAGEKLLGLETSLWVLDRLSSPKAPKFFERRGSEYYPLLKFRA